MPGPETETVPPTSRVGDVLAVPSRTRLAADRSDLDDELLARGEELDDAQGVEERADPHRGEEVLGPAAPFLAGLVDLGRGDRLGEGQVGIADHDPAEERHEQDAQDAADEEEGRGLQVCVDRVEFRPDAGDEEGRDGEDRARGDGLADRADRPGHVLLEDRAAHELEEGHADDRRRVGRGDRHPGPEAEVGVGRAEDDGQDQADEDGLEREFLHLGLFGDDGLMAHATTPYPAKMPP